MRDYIILLVLCLSAVSCRKSALPACNGNCMEVHVTGDVTLQPADKGLPGVPVTVLLSGRNCLICSETNAGVQNTGTDGKFDISFTIDSTLLSKNNLSVYVSNKNGYISIPFSFTSDKYISQQVLPRGSPYDSTFHFQFYPQANLSVRLVRTQTDSYAYFSLEHSFGLYSGNLPDYVTDGNHPLVKDTVFQLTTAAGVYTTVSAIKNSSPGNNTIISDSIICAQNANNAITINY